MNGKRFIYIQGDKICIIHYCKKCLRNVPLTGAPNTSPSNFARSYVLLYWIAMPWKGPSQRLSNFPWFSIASFLTSHFNTGSPVIKFLSLDLLSNISFNIDWWAWYLSFTWSLTYWTSTSWLVLLYISSNSTSLSCNNFITRRLRCMGNITSIPYASWNGGVPRGLLMLNLSSQTVYFRCESQYFLFWDNTFLMIFMRFFLDDLANPFPCG